MMVINKEDKKTVVKINNSIRGIKAFIVYEFVIYLVLLYFKAFETGDAHFVFPLLTAGNVIVHIMTACSYEANEKLIITPEYVILRFYAWKIPIYERKMKNTDTLNISYDEKMRGSIKFIFKSSYSIFEPEMYRLMKFEQDGVTHSFGYKLEKEEYEQVKDIVLKCRSC